MGTILELWGRDQCPIEDGLFYPDDTFCPIAFKNDQVLLSQRRPISAELSDQWVDLDINPNCTFIAQEFIVWAGSGAWEGEGFIALEVRATEGLVWLLHLPDAGSFAEVSLKNDVIYAVSREYPVRLDWRVPVSVPQDMLVLRTYENRSESA